jgi:hypothetical protein
MHLIYFFLILLSCISAKPCYDMLHLAESEETGLFLSPNSTATSSPFCPSTLDLVTRIDRKARDSPLFVSDPKLTETVCKLRWFHEREMCQTLSSPPTSVILIGDSVTRHLAHALQIAIRGDREFGALQANLTDDVKTKCGCDKQYTVKMCRSFILKDTLLLPINPCPSARLLYFGATEASEFDLQALVKVISSGSVRTVILLGGWGFHNRLNAKEVYSNLVLPVHRAAQLQKKDVHIICLGVHSLQDNHPQQYIDQQSNPRAIRYNTLLKRLCRELGLPFFDSFALSKRAKSWDGMHYGLVVNLLKAQFVMNYIAELNKLQEG